MGETVSLATIKFNEITSVASIEKLQRILIRSALLNLFLVALMGALLRSFPFISSFPLEYKNILHGHSHVAFGGWVMPALLGLLLKNFPLVQQKVAYRHWRNITFLLLASAYGMLIAFPIQGYEPVSIFFSTLSIVAGFYLAIVIWKRLPALKTSVSLHFLKAGIFYMVLSSMGPLATGPLIALGKTGTPLYFDVIYFFLHFQYNGWFLFALMALFYKSIEEIKIKTNGTKVFWLLNIACTPTYFLSVLWHQPPLLFNVVAGIAAFLQCAAMVYLIKDMLLLPLNNKLVKTMLYLSFVSLVAKIVLQFISALPSIAELAYLQRNFVIAYLHLVLLGCISLFLIAWIINLFVLQVTKFLKTGVLLFIAAFIGSEIILVFYPVSAMLNYSFPYSALLLFLFSLLQPLSIAIIASSFVKRSEGNKI